MKRVGRYTFNPLTVLSLLLCMATVAGYSSEALACSGPGAWTVMTDADIYALWCAFWVTILLVPSVYMLARSGHPLLAASHLILLLLHPSWTVSAWHGDCGNSKRSASTTFVVLAGIAVPEAAMVTLLFGRSWPWRRTNTKTGLCPVCNYDLRGTPDRCPECGTVPPKPTSPSTS